MSLEQIEVKLEPAAPASGGRNHLSSLGPAVK